MENKYVTKKDLKEGLKETADEILSAVNKGFQEQTKFFRGELKDGINGVRGELKDGINGVRNELKSEIKDFRREVLENNEKMMTELKTIRQEQVANIGAHDRMQGKIGNHEVRIKKLELKSISAR